MLPRRERASSLSMAMGSSLRLALVITRALHARVGEEQMLQRRIGQKNAEPGNAGRDRGRDVSAGIAREQHDRTRGRLQQRFFFVGDDRRGHAPHP